MDPTPGGYGDFDQPPIKMGHPPSGLSEPLRPLSATGSDRKPGKCYFLAPPAAAALFTEPSG